MVLKWTPNESGPIFGSTAIGPKDKALSVGSWMRQGHSCSTSMAQIPWCQFQWLPWASPLRSGFSRHCYVPWAWRSPPPPTEEDTFVEHSLYTRCSHLIPTTSVARLLLNPIYTLGGKGGSERSWLLPRDTQLVRGRAGSKSEAHRLSHSLSPDLDPERDLRLPSCDSAPGISHLTSPDVISNPCRTLRVAQLSRLGNDFSPQPEFPFCLLSFTKKMEWSSLISKMTNLHSISDFTLQLTTIRPRPAQDCSGA